MPDLITLCPAKPNQADVINPKNYTMFPKYKMTLGSRVKLRQEEFLKFFIYPSINKLWHLFIYLWVHACAHVGLCARMCASMQRHSTGMEVRGQLVGVGSLLKPRGSWR